MKVKVSFAELGKVLGYSNTILNDKSVEDKNKNVIFHVLKDSALIIGYNALTFARTVLNSVETEGVEDLWEFQVRSSDLNKIITNYSNLYKTKVENLEFEKYGNKIRLFIHEEAKEEEDSKLAQVSTFVLDDLAVIKSIQKEIAEEFPEEVDLVESSDLLLYLDSLFPLMSNDAVSGSQSKLNFADDYVFVLGSAMSTFCENKLPDSFKGLTLGYSSVNFLQKLCAGAENIEVQRTDKYVCIKSGDTEAFLKFLPIRVKYQGYLQRRGTDNGIVLDRLYFKDVLKRMNISSLNGKAKICDEGLEVSNENFNQIIPLNNKKGDVDNLEFKLSVPVLLKAIVGDDSIFFYDLYMYFTKSNTGYSVYIKDKKGFWFSLVQVRK